MADVSGEKKLEEFLYRKVPLLNDVSSNCSILVTGPIMPFLKVFPAGSVIELCGAAVLRTSEDCNWTVFASIFSPFLFFPRKRHNLHRTWAPKSGDLSIFTCWKGIFTDWKASQMTVDMAKWWDRLNVSRSSWEFEHFGTHNQTKSLHKWLSFYAEVASGGKYGKHAMHQKCKAISS